MRKYAQVKGKSYKASTTAGWHDCKNQGGQSRQRNVGPQTNPRGNM